MDWSGCELVEVVPGKVSGQPIIRGARILADSIVEDHEMGSPIEEIAENYPSITTERILSLLLFAESREENHPVASRPSGMIPYGHLAAEIQE